MSVLCTGPCRPEDRGGPRQAMAGCYLCEQCEDRAWKDLHWIADAWGDLEQALVAGGGGLSEPVTGTKDPGIVLADNVIDLRATITTSLRYWVHVILDECPKFTGPGDVPADALARYVATHLKRLTRHHDEGLATSVPIELTELRHEMRKVAYPSGGRVFTPEPLIPCMGHGTSDLGERIDCTGHYRIYVKNSWDSLPDMTCSEDRTHVLEPSKWRRAGQSAVVLAAIEDSQDDAA